MSKTKLGLEEQPLVTLSDINGSLVGRALTLQRSKRQARMLVAQAWQAAGLAGGAAQAWGPPTELPCQLSPRNCTW